MLIEDWKRDFTTNYAATSPSAKDNRLHPVESKLPPQAIADQITQWATQQPRWTLENSERLADGTVTMHLVRTTFVWRFKDDIHVTISPQKGAQEAEVSVDSEGSLVTAKSQSRVGKGDLGQNPRNLRELLAAVRKD